jgi:hypothetical protein
MRRLTLWAVATSVTGISVFGFFCLTVIHFNEGALRLSFQAPWGIKLDAELNRGGGNPTEIRALPHQEESTGNVNKPGH